MKYTKLIVTVLVFIYCLYYASSPASWHFIDNADLIIHEAGHVVFSIFGEFIYILGGSLMQVLLPGVFVGYFVFKNQYYSASILLYWVAVNLINVSVYAGDAVRMQLPLLGGDRDGHDWNQLLFRTGLLHHTAAISAAIFWSGIAVMAIALVWGLYLSFDNRG